MISRRTLSNLLSPRKPLNVRMQVLNDFTGFYAMAHNEFIKVEFVPFLHLPKHLHLDGIETGW